MASVDQNAFFDLMVLNPNSEEQTMEKESQNIMDDLNKILKVAIESLDPMYRDILILIHYQNLTYKEAAEVLDIPENTAKVHMHRAIKALQK